MNIETSILTLLFTGGIFLTFGDISMKKWMTISSGSFSTNYSYYIIGMIFYAVGLTLFAFSLKHKNLAIATIILVFFNIFSISIVGYLFFGEKFSLTQIIGILAGLLSVTLLEIGS